MPQRKLRLTREAENDHRRSLELLKSFGIHVGCTGIRPQPEALDISLSSYADTYLYELTGGEVGIIVPIVIRPLRSRVVMRDCQITLPWESTGFEIRDAEVSPWYDYLLRQLGWQPRTVLNHWIVGAAPLPHKLAGVIIGVSSVEIPLQFPENMPVPAEITFTDDRGLQYELSAHATLDRKMRQEAQQRMRDREAMYVSQRTRLFGPNKATRRTDSVAALAIEARNQEETNRNPQPRQEPKRADHRPKYQ